MRARTNRKRRSRGGCIGALWLTIVLLAFVIAAFYLAPKNNVTSPVPAGEVQSARTHHASAVHTRRHQVKEQARTEQTEQAEEPGNTVQTPEPPEATVESPAPPAETAPTPPHANRELREFARGNSQSTRIALTFDAGAASGPTTEILDTLAKHGVHATFFLTGKWINQNPDLTRRIASEGHEIGNHTYSHKHLTALNADEISEEVDKTEQLVLQLTGHSTKPLLRIPFGDRNRRVLSVLQDLGYRSIYWDLDSWDSVKKGITADEIESRVLGKVRDGSIILMHCGSKPTADALDSMLDHLESSGYQPVTVSELLSSE